MKKYFITGLATLLPLALTIVIVAFIVNLFTNPFIGIVQEFFRRHDLLETNFLFFTADQVQLYVSKILILTLLFFFIVILGMLTQWVIVHYFIRLGDYIFHRIPVVRTIYKTSQDVIKTIFGGSSRSFKQVVLVPFPNPQSFSVGLVTREDLQVPSPGVKKSVVAVFVPTTPNPTSGFLVMYEPEKLIYLDMKVEDAFKYIISCGVIQSPFNSPINEKVLVEASEEND